MKIKFSRIILSMFLSVSFLFLSCNKDTMADFSSDRTEIWAYQDVSFADLSTNKPTSWAWNFQYGMTSDSTVKNPVARWSSDGKFDVTLCVKNSSSSATITKVGYVTVNPNLIMWSDFNGDTIYVYLSLKTALNENNYDSAFDVQGKISTYYATPDKAPKCGTTDNFVASASGTVFYYAFDDTHHWVGSNIIKANECNQWKFTTATVSKAAVVIVTTCTECNESKNFLVSPKMLKTDIK